MVIWRLQEGLIIVQVLAPCFRCILMHVLCRILWCTSKLLLMLKKQYHCAFKVRKLKSERMGKARGAQLRDSVSQSQKLSCKSLGSHTGLIPTLESCARVTYTTVLNVRFLSSFQWNMVDLLWGTWTTCWWWRRSLVHQRLLGSVTVPTQTSVSTSWCVTATRPRRRSTCPRCVAGRGGEAKKHLGLGFMWRWVSFTACPMLSTNWFQSPNLKEYTTCQICPSFLSY